MSETTFQAKTFDNFISPEEVTKLLNFCKTTDIWRPVPDSFWDKRVINYYASTSEIKNILESLVIRIQDIMIKEYQLDKPVYPDTVDVVRWFEGMSQDPHCDDMSNVVGWNDKMKNRHFGCVVYLNDDYEGGRTYYPNHNFEIEPKSGRVAIHLGDCNHMHGVTPVSKNIRYTVASFWSFNKEESVKGINYKV
jgi:hypothetical protein